MKHGEVSAAPVLLLGTVRSLDGQPLPGVVVRLRPAGGVAVSTTVTGADGSYRIVGLEPGRYDVELEREGYLSARSKIRLVAGKQRYDVGLQSQ